MARSNLVPYASEKLIKEQFLVATLLWNSKGQGQLVTLAKDHKSVVCQHFNGLLL